MKFDPSKKINGTFGDLWINDYYLAEVLGLQAKATINKEEVKQTGSLTKGYKVTGVDGKGTVKINKVSSLFIKLLSDNIKEGKLPTFDIISKLADPASDGIERVKLSGCTFDELTLADWEAGKLGEESYPFTFTSWEILDMIEPQ